MKKNEIILGIGGYTEEAAACLINNGKILGAIEEERFTRVKHQGGWPEKSIKYLLDEYNIKEKDITHISFCYKPWLRIRHRIPYRLMMLPRYPLISSYIIFKELEFIAQFIYRLKKLKKKSNAKLYYMRHHLAHAANVFYTSPFKEAAFYSVDQRGEWDTTLWGKGAGQELTIYGQTKYPHSLGIFYAAITQHLGFGAHDEYKVMGLSAYGKPVYFDQLIKVIYPSNNNQFRIDKSYFRYHITRGYTGESFFNKKFFDEFGPTRDENEKINEHHMDFAASAQKVFEECVFHQLKGLYKIAKTENLCITGGCGLNGAMDGKIYDNTPFKNVFLSSTSADNGLGLGGGLYIKHKILGHKRNKALLRADLGTSYSDDEIQKILELYKLNYEKHDDIIPPTVALLLDGNIVGWFQGKMEFGARALGYRSILANPTLPEMKDKINKYVKFRETFRPFAPSVIEEEARRFFVIHDPIPFMTSVCGVTEEGIKKLPATTHVNNTARPQTIAKEHSPLYWKLIYEFGKKSGVPVLLNTSFNVMGEPIVENPIQAIRCFFSAGLDALVIGKFILKKRGN